MKNHFICPQCGTELPIQATECHHCSWTNRSTLASERTSWITGGMVVLILASVLIAWRWIHAQPPSPKVANVVSVSMDGLILRATIENKSAQPLYDVELTCTTNNQRFRYTMETPFLGYGRYTASFQMSKPADTAACQVHYTLNDHV